MNDSGFWVVSKMSGMTEGEALKTYTMLLSIMGFVGMIVILILAKLFPLV
jgi:GntP family gluconate:H+ symporter